MVSTKPRQKFPNRPVLGFWRDLQAAATDYIAVQTQTPELLAAHRAGVEDARIALTEGFRWLCYLASRNPQWDAENTEGLGWRNELWGTLGQLLGNAIDRLRSGEKKAKTLSDVDAYLRSELSRAPGIYKREINENLLVPRSTKATLKRNNQPEATALKRKRYIEHDGRLVDPLRLLATPEPTSDSDPRLDVDETPLERMIWSLVRAGMSERDIAASTGQKVHAIKKIKAAMISRVRAA